MKPFNLEDALAGDKVMLRNGGTAMVAAQNNGANNSSALIGWDQEHNALSWTTNGMFYDDGDSSIYDIIGMDPKKEKREFWINVLKGGHTGVCTYETEALAMAAPCQGMVMQRLRFEYEIEV